MDSIKYPADPALAAIVGELSVNYPSFRKWWAVHDDPDQQMIVWTAQPGSPSHDGLRMLASWAADQPHLASEPDPYPTAPVYQ